MKFASLFFTKGKDEPQTHSGIQLEFWNVVFLGLYLFVTSIYNSIPDCSFMTILFIKIKTELFEPSKIFIPFSLF